MHALFLFVMLVHAQSGTEFAGRTEMNGLAFKDLVSVTENGILVTVRYRQDSHEMRFTYANELAAAGLKNGRFADGAIFGKIGRITEEDPAFHSSLVPSGTKRFQFMIKDQKKFSQTGGWGYALFDQDGKTFNDEPHATTEACAACHALAKDRGFVFSQFMDSKPKGFGVLNFDKVKVASLPENVRHWIPVRETEANALRGDLRKNPFPGTLDEIAPALEKQTLLTGKSTILLSEDHRRFSLLILDRLNKSCRDANSVSLLSIRSAPEISGGLVRKSYCVKR